MNTLEFTAILDAIRWHLFVQTILLCVNLAAYTAAAIKIYLLWRQARG